MGIFMAWLETLFKRESIVHRYYVVATTVAVVSGMSFVSGCTGESIVTPDGQLTISPASTSFDIVEFRDSSGNCVFSPDFYQDVPVNLVLTDELNRALGDALVTVYVDYTGNTFSGPESLQLFSDNNGNRVIDTVDELVSGVGDEAFTTRTDDDNGTVSLLLRVNLSCSYRGSLYAFSGPVAGSISISVNNISEMVDDPVNVEEEIEELLEDLSSGFELGL